MAAIDSSLPLKYHFPMKQETDFTSMNVSLPKVQRAFIEGCVASDGYGSVSEYIRELIRCDEKRRARDDLERKLLEGFESESIPVTPEYWEKKRRELMKRHSRKPS